MKNIFKVILLLAIMAGSMSCATIFTKGSYPITIESNPAGANITVVNRASNTIYTGSTPSIVTLKASAGYMKREEYSVTFIKEGYAPRVIPLTCKLDGWYIGNILIGGLVGMLIVDPASGAMYKFEETGIYVNLREEDTSTAMKLQVIDINQVPKDAKLTRIN